MLVFSTAFGRWAAAGNRRPFADLADEALQELQARATMLGQAG